MSRSTTRFVIAAVIATLTLVTGSAATSLATTTPVVQAAPHCCY
jgi:hypothetical protein